MDSLRLVTLSDEPDDEELMRRLADGQEEALAPLHARYAALVYAIAARSLDRAAAEDVVQEVFVAVWRKAKTFDPARGTVRPWLLQIARTRVVNELRRQGRRPTAVVDPEGLQLATVPDSGPGPDESSWREYQRVAVREAIDALPPAQRQALSLAFFDDLSHQQIAQFLGLPLGTTKSRIRAGMQQLRVALVPLMAVLALVLVGGLVTLGNRADQRGEQLDRNHAALRMVTSSDSTVTRMTAVGATDPTTHATYRTAPGATLAVVNLSHFPPAPAGQTYQLWAQYGGTWQSLGAVSVDGEGHAMVIVDQPATGGPEALQVTLEQEGGSTTPRGQVVVAWTGP